MERGANAMTEATIESPGCVVILVDESAAMDSSVQEEVEFGRERRPEGVMDQRERLGFQSGSYGGATGP